MYKLIFYVPVNDAEKVKSAIFVTGAGTLGNYSHCSWETQGVGQFKPLVGSNPSIGQQYSLERVDELRVEILCTDKNLRSAIVALKDAHPYEEVAFEVYKIFSIDEIAD